MTAYLRLEVHPTGAAGVWVVRPPGAAPWTGIAVFWYDSCGCYKCEEHGQVLCEHVNAVIQSERVKP